MDKKMQKYGDYLKATKGKAQPITADQLKELAQKERAKSEKNK